MHPCISCMSKHFHCTAVTMQAYGSIDRMDPTCQHTCTDSPFVILQHHIHGSMPLDQYDGLWHSHIIIKHPGRYAIRLEVDGVTSPIIFFRAHSKAARIELVRQPKTRLEGNASNAGDLFDVQPSKANGIHVKISEHDTTECQNSA